MSVLVPIALTLVLTSLGAVHVYWGLGFSTPSISAVPQEQGRPLFAPSRLACFVVAAALLIAAFVAASRGQLLLPSGRGSLIHWAAIAAGCVFLLRGVGEFRYIGLFKSRRGSRFATLDTWFYSPLCLLIAAGFLFVALW